MGLVEGLIKQLQELELEKQEIASVLQEIAEYFQPEKASFFGAVRQAAERLKIFDSTPEEALDILAAALQTLLTSPVHTWFSISLVLDSEDVSEEVKEWLSRVQDLMIAKFNSEDSGFHSAVHELYLDLPAFGTGAFFTDEFEGIRFQCIPLNEIVIAENARGVIDTVFRSFEMTARQVVEKWPKGASAEIQRMAKDCPQRKIKIIHAVFPRKNYVEGSKKSKDLPIASVYFEVQTKKILNESGYHEMPYMVPRWSKSSGQVWGRGPGHKALPDVRVLNELSRSEMIAVDKASDPANILPHDGFLTDFDSSGGALNYHRGTGDIREKIMTMGSDADLVAIGNSIVRKQDSIKRKFLNHKLQMVGGPQKTAEEVRAILKEGMTILGPVLGRMQPEFLAPLISRVFSIMLRNGELPSVPEELQGQDLRIQYVSPISRAQKETDADAVKQAFAYLAPFAQIDPSILKNFDLHAIARDSQELYGFKAKYLKSPEVMKKEAQAEAAAQQKQNQMVEASQEMALVKQAKELRNEQAA